MFGSIRNGTERGCLFLVQIIFVNVWTFASRPSAADQLEKRRWDVWLRLKHRRRNLTARPIAPPDWDPEGTMRCILSSLWQLVSANRLLLGKAINDSSNPHKYLRQARWHVWQDGSCDPKRAERFLQLHHKWRRWVRKSYKCQQKTVKL